MSTIEGIKNVVLVHGAFADGSGWRNVYENLTGRGYRVSVVQNPLTSFADDLAATKRVLDAQDGPSILVGCGGDDDLTGGNSTDLLVGGDGSDRLNGTAGNDILVAANIVDPTTLAEDVVFSHLVAALNGGPITADDDGAVDRLQGAAGTDAFYYHLVAGPGQDIVLGQAEVKHNA